jgi:uncharacterized membrane protein
MPVDIRSWSTYNTRLVPPSKRRVTGNRQAEAHIDIKDRFFPPRVRCWLRRGAPIIALVVIGVFLFTPPWNVLLKTRLIGYAICHQLPDRSFHAAGEQMPLCARCSGTFVGALVGFAVLVVRGRRRAASLPPTAVAVVLVCCIAALAVDGINSYLSFFPRLPHLYQPQNWLRLTTGMLNGIALSCIVLPVLNYSLWSDAVEAPSVRNFKELGMLVAVGAVIATAVLLELPPLLYPLAILSVTGVLVLLTALNTTLVLTLINHRPSATRWRQAWLPLLVGLAASFVEIGAIDVGRYFITRGLGFPF